MKFAFITPWYGMFAGGLEVEFRRYAQALVAAGHHVEVLTTCSQSPYHNWQSDYFDAGQTLIDGVTVHRFKTNKKHFDKYRHAAENSRNDSPELLQTDFFTYGIASDELIDAIAHYDDEWTLVCGPYFHALSYLALTRYPNRIYLRPALHLEAQARWPLTAKMLQAAKGLFFATEAEKDVAVYCHGQRLGKTLIEQAVIGVPVDIAAATDNVDDICQRYQLPERFFLYVGRKETGKGVDRLVTWYKYYLTETQSQRQASLPLVFLGEGDQRLIPQDPRFIDLGFVPEADKRAIVAKAQGLINLSPNESFSLVIMEAWAQRTPVIVSHQCNATSEHCLKSGGGFTVDSPAFMTQALQQLLDSDVRQRMGQAGRDYLMAHYPIGKVIDQFLRVVAA